MRDAEGAAERLDDQRRLGRAWGLMGNLLCFAGRRAESEAISERAGAVGEAIGDLVSQISANTNLGFNAYSAGHYRKAEAFQYRILELIPRERFRDRFERALLPAVNAMSNLARALAQRGAFDEAVRHGQAAVELAEELAHPYSLAVAHSIAGHVHRLRGDVAQARAILNRARAVAEELRIRFLVPQVALDLSAVSVLDGHVQDALHLAPAARVAIDEVGLRWMEAVAELRLGEALLAASRVDEARSAATRALDLARERGEQGHEAWTLRLLGEIATHPDVTAVDVAEGYYRNALVLAERLDMRPLVAHCHLGLGNLYRRTGNRAKAAEHLSTATTIVPRNGHELLAGEG
jgi:tetratricopeptide (TPR) repeat protein